MNSKQQKIIPQVPCQCNGVILLNKNDFQWREGKKGFLGLVILQTQCHCHLIIVVFILG